MRLGFAVLAVAALLVAGCGDDKGKPDTAGSGSGTPAAETGAAGGGPGPGGPPGMGPGGLPGGPPGGMGLGGGAPVEMTIPADPTPVAIEGGIAKLSSENSKIEFLGTHAGPRPDPRLGGFEKISGQAEVDAATKSLKSVTLAIDATSVWTQIGGPLTNHLKNPDFFDVQEYPDAKFQSTSVEAVDAGEGKYTVNGDLTLHGVTKPISVPARIKVTDAGLTLISQFTIDRTEFGMTGVVERVEKSVSLTVVIGDKTQPKSGGGFGGGRGGPPGGGPGRRGPPGGGPPGGGPPGGGPPGGATPGR